MNGRSSSGNERDESRQADAAKDTVGSILRSLGQHAFDIEGIEASEFRRRCEAWAQHILIAGPPPGVERTPDAVDPTRRDWAGVQRFVQDHRKLEFQHVVRSVSELRKVIWSTIQGVRNAFTQDQQTDDTLLAQLSHLKTVVDERSIEDIKREVLTTVSSLTQLVEERKTRQQREMEELGAQVSALATQLQEAKRDSSLDGLTQIYNRRSFDEYVTKVMSMRDVFGQAASLVMVDIDHFKWVNDTYGHQVGDVALKEVANILVRSFPRKNDFVARYGGEEFAVVLPETTLADATRLAERLLDAIRALIVPTQKGPLKLTASSGVSQIVGIEPAETWIERADRSLYRAKRTGRDRVVAAE